MTVYPAAGDYYKAVQFPSRSFTVPRLQAAEFVWDSLGPTLARGSSAVVFQAAVEGKTQALRCYIRNDASSRDRYSALNVYLAGRDLNPFVSGATWLDGAIMVNRTSWPVLTMEWIDGRTLNEYVDFLVSASNTAALTTLAANWRELVALLQRSEFGHGDLQHGNVMVDQDGQYRLVDFDGVWIPPLAGQSPPTEFGHPNYQHPGLRIWNRWVDTFSALVIYLSLTALSRDPALWLALYNSKNLLFAKNDFFPPFETEVWKQLAALRDPQVNALARRLQECCAPDWVAAGSLEMLLDQPTRSLGRPSVPAGQRWWEKPATGATAAPSRPWAQQAPAGAPGSPGSPGPSARAAPGTAGTPGLPGLPAARRPRPLRLRPLRPRLRRLPSPRLRRLSASSAVSGGSGRRGRPRGGFRRSLGRSFRRAAVGRRHPPDPAPAVRPAQHGRYRADAAPEPEDGATGGHHLVVPAGSARCVPPRPARPRALWLHALWFRAPRFCTAGFYAAGFCTGRCGTVRSGPAGFGAARAHAPGIRALPGPARARAGSVLPGAAAGRPARQIAAAESVARRGRARPGGRPADHRSVVRPVHRRDRRPGGGRLGYLAAGVHVRKRPAAAVRPRLRPRYECTTHSCRFQYASSSPALVPTRTAMTRCSLSVLTMIAWVPLVYSEMVPVRPSGLMAKADWQLTRKSVKFPVLSVHSLIFRNFAFLRRALSPLASAVWLG